MSSPAIKFLTSLVACPSVNPGDNEPTDPIFGEERLSRLLADILRPWGAEITIEDTLPKRPNFIARFRGKDSSRTLLLEAHADTVQIGGMTIPPFEPTIRDGRLYGRGSCDTKGSMAAMLAAIQEVIETDGQPPTDLIFVSTCNEECGAAGVRALVASELCANAAVIGEPTQLKTVHAHKGVIRWRITTHGIAAHSSLPEKGVSAISQMNKVLTAIDGPLKSNIAKKVHPLLGSPRVSVGTINGGTQFNIVPSQCVITIDRRLIPAETAETATDEITRFLKEFQQEDPSFKFDIECLTHYPPFYEDAESPVVKLAQTACRNAGLSGDIDVAPYGTNAGFLKGAGIPCVVLGPGSAEQAHTVDEFIEIEQVERAVSVYTEIIRSF